VHIACADPGGRLASNAFTRVPTQWTGRGDFFASALPAPAAPTSCAASELGAPLATVLHYAGARIARCEGNLGSKSTIASANHSSKQEGDSGGAIAGCLLGPCHFLMRHELFVQLILETSADSKHVGTSALECALPV